MEEQRYAGNRKLKKKIMIIFRERKYYICETRTECYTKPKCCCVLKNF